METRQTSSGKVQMDIDGFLTSIGELGRYQKRTLFLLCIIMVLQALQILIMFFASQDPGWQCIGNSTLCTLNGTLKEGDAGYKVRCSLPRNQWKYAKGEDYSVISTYDLACGKEHFVQFSTSIYFVGWSIGGLMLGWVADRYGRKLVLFPSLGLTLLIGFLSIWSPNIELIIVSRFVTGFLNPGISVPAFIMATELVGPRRRPLAGILLLVFATFGIAVTGVKSYLIPDWKLLFVSCTVPYTFVLIFAKFLPESIRWLYVHKNPEDVLQVLRNIAKVNKASFPDAELAPLSKKKSRGSSLLNLFRSRKQTVESLIQGFSWFVISLVYYGVTLASKDLSGNLYRDYILGSLLEVPANLAGIYFCTRFGRKKTVVIPLIIGSIACVLVAAVPQGTSIRHWNGLRVALGVSGKFSLTIAFNSIYTWSAELYPTILRSEGMGYLQTTSRMGAASAPWIAKTLKVVHVLLPFSLMGGITFVSACFLTFLPETKGVATKEVLEESEEVARHGEEVTRHGEESKARKSSSHESVELLSCGEMNGNLSENTNM